MFHRTRREVLMDVGRGMFLAGLGTGAAAELGLSATWAADEPPPLHFGDLEPLVCFMQETPPEKLLPAVVGKLQAGTDLKEIVAAAALANARAFGGEDYVGFHTLMALVPAYRIAMEEPDAARRPLAVLKVLHRNASRLRDVGGRKNEVLKTVQPGQAATGEQLRDLGRKADLDAAERAFAAAPPSDALDQLMFMVDDGAEVHRTVLVSRSLDLVDFVGALRRHTLLRQSVHYCVKAEKNANTAKWAAPIRETLPKVLEQHGLPGKSMGTRRLDDGEVLKLSETIFAGSPADGAGAVGAALAEGVSPESIGEAITLAANQLVLRDEGRPAAWAQANKPVGSVHGDSVGVHACDSVNAWRAIGRAGNARTTATSLILAAFQVTRDRGDSGVNGRDFLKWEGYPRAEHLEKVRSGTLKELDAAVREKDQARAAALTFRLGEAGVKPAEVFAVLRRFAISEDGALHAEKFYRTTSEDFAASRPAFAWRHLIALARVSASAFGYAAPGFRESCELLKVT